MYSNAPKETAGTVPVVLVNQGSLTCGLPVAYIAEVSRPLPLQRISGVPASVIGLSIVRGQPLPVLDLGLLLGADRAAVPGRYVMLNLGERRAVLAVEAVTGVRRLPQETLGQVPPLLQEANADLIAGIARLDRKLLVALEAARIVPQEVWERLAGQTQVPS